MIKNYKLKYDDDDYTMMITDITMMNAPTEVIVNTFVRSIDKIDDYKMEWVLVLKSYCLQSIKKDR